VLLSSTSLRVCCIDAQRDSARGGVGGRAVGEDKGGEERGEERMLAMVVVGVVLVLDAGDL
jgi:hypothetical protein